MNLNSRVAEKQFFANTRKSQPAMTVVEYQKKNLLYETNLKNETSINVSKYLKLRIELSGKQCVKPISSSGL